MTLGYLRNEDGDFGLRGADCVVVRLNIPILYACLRARAPQSCKFNFLRMTAIVFSNLCLFPASTYTLYLAELQFLSGQFAPDRLLQ